MFNFFDEVKKGAIGANFVDDYHLVNISGKILYADGHKGLLTLSQSEVSIKVKGGVVRVTGERLTLAELTENTIKICGQIDKVEVVR